jgi:hypothetical protein
MPTDKPLTTEDLAAIRARCEAAEATGSTILGVGHPAIYTFVAHAREDVPRLLAEVERLRALPKAGPALLEQKDQTERDLRDALAEVERWKLAKERNAYPRQPEGRGGWTLDFEWLRQVRDRADEYLSLESVEASLLAAESIQAAEQAARGEK